MSRQLEGFLSALDYAPLARIKDRSIYPILAAEGLTIFDFDTKAMQSLQEDWIPLFQEIEAAN